jgi:hypothetical protein
MFFREYFALVFRMFTRVAARLLHYGLPPKTHTEYALGCTSIQRRYMLCSRVSKSATSGVATEL